MLRISESCFMTASVDEAEVTIIKSVRSSYCTVEANYTDRRKTSRGLSATAEFFVTF